MDTHVNMYSDWHSSTTQVFDTFICNISPHSRHSLPLARSWPNKVSNFARAHFLFGKIKKSAAYPAPAEFYHTPGAKRRVKNGRDGYNSSMLTSHHRARRRVCNYIIDMVWKIKATAALPTPTRSSARCEREGQASPKRRYTRVQTDKWGKKMEN